MTNSDDGGRLAHEIELAFAAAYGLPQTDPRRPGRDSWANSAPQMGKIVVRTDRDHLDLGGSGPAELYPADARRFLSLERITDITVTIDEKGAVTGFGAGGLQARRTR
jgi:hypothetical protein